MLYSKVLIKTTKHKKRILHNLNKFEQQELKWHFALMLTYIQLTEKESEKVYTVFVYHVPAALQKLFIIFGACQRQTAPVGFKSLLPGKSGMPRGKGGRRPGAVFRGVEYRATPTHSPHGIAARVS